MVRGLLSVWIGDLRDGFPREHVTECRSLDTSGILPLARSVVLAFGARKSLEGLRDRYVDSI